MLTLTTALLASIAAPQLGRKVTVAKTVKLNDGTMMPSINLGTCW